jgi:hypothetical protein
MHAHTLSVRPLKEADIPFLIEYWFNCSDEDYIRMGVDKSKLMSKKDCENYFLNICNTPIEQAHSFYLIWLINNEPVGHNSLNEIIHGEIANLHLHMWNSKFRGQGFGPILFCKAVVEFYKLFQFKLILCEPKSSNLMPNKMLSKIGYTKWKTTVSKSSEMSLTCETNSYLISKDVSLTYLSQLNYQLT